MKVFKFFWLFLLVLAVLIVFVAYPWWGRTLIYRDDDTITKYPGFGQKTEYTKPQVLVMPKQEGYPFFVGSTFVGSYPPDQYDITEIPVQTRLIYAVGNFAGWEDIVESQDKYILLTTSEKGKLDKYRVAFQDSELFSVGVTVLNVEDVGLLRYDKERENSVDNYGERFKFTDLTYAKVRRLLRKGDALIILPVWDIPSLSKKDDQGNYLVSGVIVRRVDLGIEWDKLLRAVRSSQ